MQMQDHHLSYLPADWSLSGVYAGSSQTPHPYADQGFNLARHIACDRMQVEANRQAWLAMLGLKQVTPMWLNQTHSATVVSDEDYRLGVSADAAISRDPTMMPVVLTADCVPIVLTDGGRRVVAAIHAGWQGLAKQIIAETIREMRVDPTMLYAWIGPCIGQAHYEVDAAFYQRFVALDGDNAVFFHANRSGHYLADLVGITRRQLQGCGVLPAHIYGAGVCTFADAGYFSHRRDGAQSGRIATFITLNSKEYHE